LRRATQASAISGQDVHVICNPQRVAVLWVRGLTQRLSDNYISNPANFYFNFLNHEVQSMNRHCINTNARALPGVNASAWMGACMTRGLGGFSNVDSRSPGEGDAASP
jgi:hypothetical protein